MSNAVLQYNQGRFPLSTDWFYYQSQIKQHPQLSHPNWHMLIFVAKTFESKHFPLSWFKRTMTERQPKNKQTNKQKKKSEQTRYRMQNVTHIKADDLLARDRHTFGPQHNSWTFCSAFQRPCLRLSTRLRHDTSCAGTVRWQRPWIACPLNHPKRTELLRMLGWLKGSIWSNLRYILLSEALDRHFDSYFAKVSPPALCKCLCLPVDA